MSWDQQFFDPIELPDGRKLVTIRDAAQYILELPNDESALPHWETAIECLMLVGEHGGDPMMANIAMMQALQRDGPKVAPAFAPETRQGLQGRSVSVTPLLVHVPHISVVERADPPWYAAEGRSVP